MMFKRRWLSLVAGLVVFAAADASAVTLNFRDSAFARGHHQASASFFDVLGPIDVTLRAENGGLEWHGRDGFGVHGQGYEKDEIEGSERLIVTFSQAVRLSTIWISDLFVEHGYRETGWFRLDGGPREHFAAWDHTGGTREIGLAEAPLVTSIIFGAPGRVFFQDHEFSLAGLSFSAAPANVPEPASVLLLGSGIVAGVLRRRRLSAQ